MKKNENVEKDIQNAIKREPLLNAEKTGGKTKAGKHLRNFILLTSLAGIGLLFNGCVGGYIATEPNYMVVNRPPQPSYTHIWIDGDWSYNRQTHMYVQKAGYWQQPDQGRVYVSGYWQTSPRGKYWVSGRWQKQNSQGVRRNR
jgi:hypothetical protein